MRLRVRHLTTYTYSVPAEGVVQVLRQTPRSHQGQRILNWRVEVDCDGHLRERRDAFGNITHTFYAERPLESLTICARGEAELRDQAGVVDGADEPFPPDVFLRQTRLTRPDGPIADLAAGCRRAEPLDALHALMNALHGAMRFDAAASEVFTPAAEALAAGAGVCQDYAHIFVAAARLMGMPARYVSGHLARSDNPDQEAAHAWAEACVPHLGWVGFDPTNGLCPGEKHLRVAVGLDYLDAAPVRGARRGGGDERLSVTVRTRDHPERSQQ